MEWLSLVFGRYFPKLNCRKPNGKNGTMLLYAGMWRIFFPRRSRSGSEKRMWNWNKSVFCVLSWAFVRTSNIIAI